MRCSLIAFALSLLGSQVTEGILPKMTWLDAVKAAQDCYQLPETKITVQHAFTAACPDQEVVELAVRDGMTAWGYGPEAITQAKLIFVHGRIACGEAVARGCTAKGKAVIDLDAFQWPQVVGHELAHVASVRQSKTQAEFDAWTKEIDEAHLK